MKKAEKKRVLVVSQNFYPETFGINDIVSDLTQKGYEIDVLTGLPNYPQGKYYDGYSFFCRGDKYYKGARVYRCFEPPRFRNSIVGICINYAVFPLSALFRALTLLHKNYSKVIVYEPSPLFPCIPALFIAFFNQSKKYIYVLDIWPESVYSVVHIKSKLIKRILKWYSKKTYSAFDELLVTSKGFIPQLENYSIERDRIHFLPQWVAEYECEHKHNPILEKYDGKKVFVFTGNVGIPQNMGVIIEAAKMLVDITDIIIIIVGDGDYLPTMKVLTLESDLQDIIVFEGRRPYTDMPLYYEAAVGLICTLKDIDLFSKIIPAKLQAYMSAGRPLVCSINGESAQIVKEAGCGFVSPAGNAKKLADNMIKLCRMDEADIRLMGLKGRQYAREYFNRRVLLNRLEEIVFED